MQGNVDEPDEYDVFLVSWEPRELLRYSTLSQNIDDPLVRKRLFEDSCGDGSVERTAYAEGKKLMEGDELKVRAYNFFRDHQAKWAAAFKDYLLSREIPITKIDMFLTSFAKAWIDGKARRQDSSEMLAIKASIRDFDLLCYPDSVGKYVINPVGSSESALFSPAEMALIFQANSGLLEAFLPDYIDFLGCEGPGAVGNIYVRRGVYMPQVNHVRKELHDLSSYSLALGPVEQFAQTWTPATKGKGFPSIFSAPLPAIQDRVVAFAPFIENMDLGQLELVTAPPVAETPLKDDGEFAGIREYSFI